VTRPPDDPTRGQHQVTISFRLNPGTDDPETIAEHFRNLFAPTLIKPAWTVHGLDVAVRVIGAAGESGTDEGRYDRPEVNAP
jgi:hypothetical protein